MRIAVIGASGGIGGALCEVLARRETTRELHALSRTALAPATPGIIASTIDTDDEASIEQAAERASATGPLDLVLVATGVLHRHDIQPEKSMAQLDAGRLAEVYRVNTIGPALVARHFLPRLSRDQRTVFAALSARVGSIGDNRLGGWYAYRASKAALNMMLKSLSIEHARSHPQGIVVALHPGTVDTGLSQPFSRRVPEGKLFSPELAASQLLQVIDGLTPDDTGGFFAWDGAPIPW